ncbi:MAG: hypothetical protein WBD31_19445 [Rubripirellula sp.]
MHYGADAAESSMSLACKGSIACNRGLRIKSIFYAALYGKDHALTSS